MLARIIITTIETMTVDVDSVKEACTKAYTIVGEAVNHAHHGESIRADVEIMIEESDQKHWARLA